MSAVAEAPGTFTLAPAGFGVRTEHGDLLELDVDRWFGAPDGIEQDVLGRAIPAVLDVGCGPARHTRWLAERRVVALGVDVSPTAVSIASERGAPVLHRSVFEPLPGEGAWGTVLLLDGNVGIGGDPVRLLRRVRSLLRPRGRVLAEVERPGVSLDSLRVAIEADGVLGPWFPWARVTVDDVAAFAAGAGFEIAEAWVAGGRWFTRMQAR